MEVKNKERPVRGNEGAARMLNRVVFSTKEGIEYEGDQRYAEIVVRDVVEGEQQRSHHAGSQRRSRKRSRRSKRDLVQGDCGESQLLGPGSPGYIICGERSKCRFMSKPEARDLQRATRLGNTSRIIPG